MNKKVFLVSGIKCGGATTFALNSAVLYKCMHPHKKIALIQCSVFPDLHTYIGKASYQSISGLFDFQGTDEWTTETLSAYGISFAGIDVFFSPSEEGTKKEQQNLKGLFFRNYDVLFLDIEKDFIASWGELFKEETHRILYLSTLAPAAQENWEKGFSFFKNYDCEKQLILNQVSKGEGGSGSIFAKSKIKPSYLLPFDEKAFWHQTFEGIPVVLQKKTLWGKALQSFYSG